MPALFARVKYIANYQRLLARKMSITSAIEDKLNLQFTPAHLEVINESHKHNVPKGSETHFKVVVVSDKFANENLLARHRAVNNCLKNELASSVHALSIVAKTPEQWKSNSNVPMSPPCLGGSKR